MSVAMSAGARAVAAYLFAYFAYVGLTNPYMPLYADHLGYTAAQIGYLTAAMQALRIVLPNIWGHVADTTGRPERLMAATALTAAVLFAGFLFVEQFWAFFVVMMLVQLFVSAQAPLAETLAVDALKGDISLYGRLRLWGSLGFVVLVLAGGPFFEWAGIGWWPQAGLLLIVIVVLAAVRIPGSGQVHDHSAAPSFWGQLKRPDVAFYFASAFFMVAAHSAMYAFYSLYLDRHGYSKAMIGFLWAVGVVFEIAVFWTQRRWITNASLYGLLLVSLAVAVPRFALIAAFPSSLPLLLLAAALHAITFAVHHSCCIGILQRWFAGALAARGQATYFSVSYGVGGTVGALAASRLWEGIAPSAAFWMASVLCALGLVTGYLSMRAHRRFADESGA
ncbi:hypothetical protein IP84_11015 [beta proteobacterium AAP99]|nr:hypothetical protein IP84_11015 [beta proteobacterium AAP99]